jgi:small subunit ribosomal protein S18
MASNNSNNKKGKPRAPKDAANPKKFKKKTSILVTDKVEYIDYKDVNLLTRFVSDRSKIRNRRVTGNSVQQQREIANAVKNAREMALLPYTKRVAQTRTSRPPRDGEGRRERGDDQVRSSQVEGAELESTEVDAEQAGDAGGELDAVEA